MPQIVFCSFHQNMHNYKNQCLYIPSVVCLLLVMLMRRVGGSDVAIWLVSSNPREMTHGAECLLDPQIVNILILLCDWCFIPHGVVLFSPGMFCCRKCVCFSSCRSCVMFFYTGSQGPSVVILTIQEFHFTNLCRHVKCNIVWFTHSLKHSVVSTWMNTKNFI